MAVIQKTQPESSSVPGWYVPEASWYAYKRSAAATAGRAAPSSAQLRSGRQPMAPNANPTSVSRARSSTG